ncbi:BgtA-20597 [Blumeria graminis f. sp. tritici]|uniref:D-lactate dehydrogenase (cytochrome) n=2 Tax=Blumeria graminis f. sp. tritici TaxID=62690 RepID=A0A9X9MFM9_BLUGR|nr:hypothetical protein BGT96224_A20597 [Blumeria graminis f. sp. tritici 96224]VDB83932.1 BgtA-20597 [Blumeria graminis f. sp. tritici]
MQRVKLALRGVNYTTKSRFLSTKPISTDTPDRSFRGQVYESVATRLARERQERQKYVDEREARPKKNYLEASALIISVALFSFWLGNSGKAKSVISSTTPLALTTPPTHNTTASNLQASWTDFVELLGTNNVSTSEQDISGHLGNQWSLHKEKDSGKPFLILYPSTTEEVSAIMQICHKRCIPVTAFSGGTSLEGQFTANRGGICIDFKKMGKILKLNKEDMDVVVQPGVKWEYLNDELSKENLFFPPDPGPGAMIGGMIGTGCSGTNAYHYGTMREWVLGLTIVLADGTIIKTRQRPRKSSAGYDLTKLFIGSEGTLGLVTEASLKLTTKPDATSVAVCSFDSIRQATDCAAIVIRSGVPVAAIELLDENQMHCVNAANATKKLWTEAPTLFFKFAGRTNTIKEQIDIIKKLVKSSGCNNFQFAKNTEEQVELWSARKQALWSTIASQKQENGCVWTGDVAVPISRLSDIIEETKEDIKKTGLFASIVGHMGDGNFHTILLYNEQERPKAEEVVHRMVKRAIEMEGTASGEHGVGLVKRDYLNHELGETTVDTMRKLKLALDPLCLLNCDKVIRVEPSKPGEITTW